jgi:hypothetical protein
VTAVLVEQEISASRIKANEILFLEECCWSSCDDVDPRHAPPIATSTVVEPAL